MGNGGGGIENSELANTNFYMMLHVGCLYVNLNLTNQLVDYQLHLPDWSNSIVPYGCETAQNSVSGKSKCGVSTDAWHDKPDSNARPRAKAIV